jgi:hypothetical protein
MSYPFYPLFRLRIDKQWTLYVDADTQGKVQIGMYYYLGDLFEILAGGKSTTPPMMLGKINQILREMEC